MTDADRTIDLALAAEERELLRRIGDDPGHVQQALSLFAGRAGWVSALLLAVQAAMFVAGLWTGWRFFQAEDALAALHWGLPSAVLLLMSLMLKLSLWPVMQTNRLLVALKRLEVLAIQGRTGGL
jgi:2-keto-3-deoxy-galactonokinase